MATIQRFANPFWADGGYAPKGEKLARIKPVPGRLLGVRVKFESSTEADLVSRGITLMSELTDGPSSPHRQAIFGPQELRAYAFARLGGLIVSRWSEPQMRDFVLNYLAPCAFFFDQANEAYNDPNDPVKETDYAVLDGMAQQEWMYAALRDKMNALTPRGAFVKGYENKCPDANGVFTPGGDPLAYLSTLQSQAGARAGLGFYSRAVSNYGRANYQTYYGGGIAEPMGRRQPYVLGYGMSRLALGSGPDLLPISILWENLETPSGPAAWNPGWAYRRDLPTGTLYQNDENMMDMNHITEATLIGHALGGGTVGWDRPDLFSDNLADAQCEQFGGQPSDVWQGKDGNGQPQKRAGHRALFRRHLSCRNGMYVGGQWAGELNDRAGWGFQYLAYRVITNGQPGPWIEPHATNAATILQAGKNLQALVLGRETGNDVGLLSVHPGNTAAGTLLEARLPSGRTVIYDHVGIEPVVIAGTLTTQSITLLRAGAVQLQ